jgi:hypothetical protein
MDYELSFRSAVKNWNLDKISISSNICINPDTVYSSHPALPGFLTNSFFAAFLELVLPIYANKSLIFGIIR